MATLSQSLRPVVVRSQKGFWCAPANGYISNMFMSDFCNPGNACYPVNQGYLCFGKALVHGCAESWHFPQMHQEPSGAAQVQLHFCAVIKIVLELQVEHLKSRFRCLGVDLRGNGGNTPSGKGPNVIHFADDICRVIQALNLRGALIVAIPVPEEAFRRQPLVTEAALMACCA